MMEVSCTHLLRPIFNMPEMTYPGINTHCTAMMQCPPKTGVFLKRDGGHYYHFCKTVKSFLPC